MLKAFILATNILMDFPNIFDSLEPSIIYIPSGVIKELDGLKRSGDRETNEKASAASDQLEEITSEGYTENGVTLPTGSQLIITDKYVKTTSLENYYDNIIIGTAVVVRKNLKDRANIVLLSNDTNLLICAHKLLIEAYQFPYTYFQELGLADNATCEEIIARLKVLSEQDEYPVRDTWTDYEKAVAARGKSRLDKIYQILGDPDGLSIYRYKYGCRTVELEILACELEAFKHTQKDPEYNEVNKTAGAESSRIKADGELLIQEAPMEEQTKEEQKIAEEKYFEQMHRLSVRNESIKSSAWRFRLVSLLIIIFISALGFAVYKSTHANNSALNAQIRVDDATKKHHKKMRFANSDSQRKISRDAKGREIPPNKEPEKKENLDAKHDNQAPSITKIEKTPAEGVFDVKQDCLEASPDGDPNKIIPACTEIINSGKYSGRNLAIAYTFRCIATERKVGPSAQAKEDIAKALEIDFSYTPALYHIAANSSKNGHTDQACSALSYAITYGFKDWSKLKKDPEMERVRNANCFEEIRKASHGNI